MCTNFFCDYIQLPIQHNKYRATICSPAKRRLNGDSLAARWWSTFTWLLGYQQPEKVNLTHIPRSVGLLAQVFNKTNSTNLYPPTKGYLRETCKSQIITPIYLTLSSPSVSFRSSIYLTLSSPSVSFRSSIYLTLSSPSVSFRSSIYLTLSSPLVSFRSSIYLTLSHIQQSIFTWSKNQ